MGAVTVVGVDGRRGGWAVAVAGVDPAGRLAALDWRTALAVARALPAGRGISRQVHGLRAMVLAVDALLAGPAAGAPDVVEVHPELSFAELAADPPADPPTDPGAGPPGALPPKKTPEGRAARVAALGRWAVPGLALDPPAGDDHLDALAAAWSAHRWATGTALTLGGNPDARGLPMRIVV